MSGVSPRITRELRGRLAELLQAKGPMVAARAARALSVDVRTVRRLVKRGGFALTRCREIVVRALPGDHPLCPPDSVLDVQANLTRGVRPVVRHLARRSGWTMATVRRALALLGYQAPRRGPDVIWERR